MPSFPIPSFNANIPVVTPDGGTSVAYTDPNSPESLMKKVATVNVQALVDRRYDSTVPTHESFSIHTPYPSYTLTLLRMFIGILALSFLFFLFLKGKPNRVKVPLLTLAIIILVLFIYSRK